LSIPALPAFPSGTEAVLPLQRICEAAVLVTGTAATIQPPGLAPP
jgi:hypothetical protein